MRRTTPTVRKALEFLAKATDTSGYTTAGELAWYMWPDSPAWNKSKNVGNRGTGARGAAMFRPAQGLLGKLKKAGLAEIHRDSHHVTFWMITEEGRKALQEAE